MAGRAPASAGTWSQDSWGVYGDAEADVTDKLSMGLAGRYERYNTFGGSFVYKVNGIYKVTPQFSVRGTIGTGFHAPSPGQSHDEILTTNFVAGNQVQTGTYPVDSPISQYFGAQTLQPEKSRNYGAGVVLKPMPSLTLTIDGYIIDVKGRIEITKNFDVTAADILAEPALAAVGEGGNINYFTNGFDTSTKGLDLVGTWRHELFDGNFTATLAYNYNKSKVTKYDPQVIGTDQIIDVAHLAPNHRATLSGNYIHGPFTFNVRENYYSWWTDAVDYPTARDAAGNITAGQKFGAKFTTDVDVSYTFLHRFTLTVGANNVFNTYPDKIKNTADNPIYVLTGSTADGQVYPRLGGPFGINGGFWVRPAVCEVCTSACLRTSATNGRSTASASDADMRRRKRDRGGCCLSGCGPSAAATASATTSAGSDRAGRARQLTTGEHGLRKKGRAAGRGPFPLRRQI